MANINNNNLLNDILRSADKHPNSKVSKLIRTVEEEPSQKNIVLLLIELSEHAEYSTDFNISLRYYLDLFERLGIDRDLVLNEAGLLLVNSSKIYSKRVDYVQSLVERQILTLSNADQEIQQQREQNEKESAEETATTSAEKPKRGRKRALDAPTDPYEVQLEPKKFKKMSEEKRFAPPKTPSKLKSLPRNIEMEQQIHPAGWLHATIYDLENEEEVDTKRNYKLFTYHIEHRYNTLVPDINFRLHFKVKDYLDAQAEEETTDDMDSAEYQRNQEWPPLSEEYVQKYINLENRVLQLEIDPTWKSPKRTKNEPNLNKSGTEEIPASMENSLLDLMNTSNGAINDVSSINDSGVGSSIMESTANSSHFENTTMNTSHETSLNNSSLAEGEGDKTANASQLQENESGLGESLLDQTNNCNETIPAGEKSQEEINTAMDDENKKTLPLDESATEESVATDTAPTTNDNGDSENQTEKNSGETTINESGVQGTNEEITNPAEATEQSSNEEPTLTLSNGVDVTTEDKDKNDSAETSDKQTCAEETNDNTVISMEKEASDEPKSNEGGGELEKQAEESKTTTETDKTQEASVDNATKEKEGFIELEVHVMNDNENEPSERLQIQIPNTDDEGVHLSDVYEGDLHMLTPNATNKDVTIHLNDELRQALEMQEHFSQETYKVPVIEQPKEHPIVCNIFKLPPKLLRRKVLFKLGPEMDLYLKARSLKPSRPPPNPREYKISKNQLLAFSLNNTDMSGILDTPPNSPGHQSEFCGFTDDDDDETTCAEFYGFTEDEQHKLVISPHRLSRDSGVGVEASILTPEKETLTTIFEENPPTTDVNSCKLNLNSALDKESTEDILNDLSESIRTALEAEIQSDTIENNSNKESEEVQKEAQKNGEGSEQPASIEESTEETKTLYENEGGENCADNSSKENETTSSDQEAAQTSSMEEENKGNVGGAESESTPATENQIESSETICVPVIEAKESSNVDSENNSNGIEHAPSGTEENNETDSAIPALEPTIVDDNSQEDNALLDLDLQGTKTKIQQWHEHLRPILAKSRERHHFDVFQLGTEIIETIQTTNCTNDEPKFTNAKPEASFDDIMDNKDRSYVSRYFLSTLLLANQSNVNIMVENKSSESPSAWSDIKLKLLSTKRHTVAIEDNIGMITTTTSANNKRKQTAAEEQEQTQQQQIKKKKVKSKPQRIEASDNDYDDETDDEPLVSLKSTPSKRRSKESPSRQQEKKFKGLTSSPATAATFITTDTSTPQATRPKEMLIISQEILSPVTELPSTSGQAAALAAQHQILVNDNNRKSYQDHRKSPVLACA